MSYCTEQEFADAFGQSELDDLTRIDQTFARAADDAASIMDGYMAVRYTLPLVAIPVIVKGWALDITRYRLWDEHAPQEVRRRYEDAIAALQQLAKGLIELPPAVVNGQATKPGESTVQQFWDAFDGFSAERVFTSETLKGY